MAYKLGGRELPETWQDECERPCIFCGTLVKHVNDGGTACVINALVGDKHESYLYCNEPPCPQIDADAKYEGSAWICGCEGDYVEVIGNTCPFCKTTKDKPVRVDEESDKCVFVYTAQIVTKRPLGDAGSLQNHLNEHGMGSYERIYLDSEFHRVHASHFFLEDWFD